MMKKKMKRSLKIVLRKGFEVKDSLEIISKDLNHSRTGGISQKNILNLK